MTPTRAERIAQSIMSRDEGRLEALASLAQAVAGH